MKYADKINILITVPYVQVDCQMEEGKCNQNFAQVLKSTNFCNFILVCMDWQMQLGQWSKLCVIFNATSCFVDSISLTADIRQVTKSHLTHSLSVPPILQRINHLTFSLNTYSMEFPGPLVLGRARHHPPPPPQIKAISIPLPVMLHVAVLTC